MRTIAVHRLTHPAVLSLSEIARIATTMGRSPGGSDVTAPLCADGEVRSVRERGGQ